MPKIVPSVLEPKKNLSTPRVLSKKQLERLRKRKQRKQRRVGELCVFSLLLAGRLLLQKQAPKEKKEGGCGCGCGLRRHRDRSDLKSARDKSRCACVVCYASEARYCTCGHTLTFLRSHNKAKFKELCQFVAAAPVRSFFEAHDNQEMLCYFRKVCKAKTAMSLAGLIRLAALAGITGKAANIDDFRHLCIIKNNSNWKFMEFVISCIILLCFGISLI